MKKITLSAIIIFLLVGGTVLTLNRLYPPVAAPTVPATPTFTTAEVSTHNTAADCYLIISNKVYNVSSYLNKHPGGVQNITNVCGKEASSVFTQIHSNRAWDLLGAYYIGILKN